MRRAPVSPGFLTNAAVGDRLRLPKEQAHYLIDVLRLSEGDEVEIFDGDGKIARGRLSFDSEVDELSLLISTIEKSTRGESPLQITLFQAIPKGKRWDWILEKACELGVHAVVPLQTARTVVQLSGKRIDQRLPRWEKILAKAARQCGRSLIPSIAAPTTIDEGIRACSVDLHLIAHPSMTALAPGHALSTSAEVPRTLGLWIGPEGGFTDVEVARLTAAGARPISLGPRILRADTAPIVALTMLQAAAGDLQ